MKHFKVLFRNLKVFLNYELELKTYVQSFKEMSNLIISQGNVML